MCCSKAVKYLTSVLHLYFVDQRLDLCKLGPNDNDTVRGQIVGK